MEDLHWADEATRDLLRFVGRRVGETRSLVLGSMRAEEVDAAHPLRAVLGDLATSGTLLRRRVGPLSPEAVRQLASNHEVERCTDEESGLGAMGQHYVRGDLVGDTVFDLSQPEVLVYEPMPNGRQRLVAVEFVVFQRALGRAVRVRAGAAANAVRPGTAAGVIPEPVRRSGLLPDPRLALEAEPGRHVPGMERAGLVPGPGRSAVSERSKAAGRARAAVPPAPSTAPGGCSPSQPRGVTSPRRTVTPGRVARQS